MRKIVIHGAGGYDRLKLEEAPDPVPGPGQVLVKTAAIGVNYADCCVRWGVYQSAKQYVGWPITPGFEFSGTVAQTGEGVTKWKKGDRVLGTSFFGAYATHVVAPEHQLFAVPKSFTMEQAAAMPAVYITAYHALHQTLRTRPGSVILVHSAAGGVGTALLQLGRLAGCKVAGVVGSSHKVETAKAFGADFVIDKSKQDLWKEAERFSPDGYDAIYDANGPETLKDGYNHLRPTGRLVCYGYHSMLPRQGGKIQYVKAAIGLLKIPRFNPMRLTDQNRGVIGFNISFLFSRKDLIEESMTDLLSWIDAGKLQPPTVKTFPLEKVAEAHAAIESGMSVGKLVLLPN